MQWLSLVTEDAGVQRLRADNRLPAKARGVDHVSPYPSSHAAQISEGNKRQQQPRKERRQQERRRNADRRKQQLPVILDTRSSHDRRQIQNRRQTRISENPEINGLARLDLYA